MLELYSLLHCFWKVCNINYHHLLHRHIIATQTCLCPECKFPCDIHYLRKALPVDNTCPMCNKEIQLKDVKEASEEEVRKLKGVSVAQQ